MMEHQESDLGVYILTDMGQSLFGNISAQTVVFQSVKISKFVDEIAVFNELRPKL